ncbi:MAG: hypothetical protein FJ278_14980 [Planctomycetes bacterium]|nr:hypothetical protein [Planctomycetota bacterium]
MAEQTVKILDPIDGAILNRHDGNQTDRGLEITVKGQAPPGVAVSVNGAPAARSGGEFTAPALISKRVQTLAAVAGEARDKATVLWDKNSMKRYRFSTDDNIWFLRDIAQHAGTYSSIFDNFYLAFWREMHRRYGARIQHNIYYQDEAGFTLAQMPDKFKGEWRDNAHWLHLTFHALQNDPPKLYINSTYAELERDFLLVTDQILRFAGEQVLSPYTTVHWGEATREGCRALRDHGILGLAGYFMFGKDGKPAVSYYLDAERTRHLSQRDYWKDLAEDLFFITHDIVINTKKLDAIVPHLDEVSANPHRQDLMEVMIHEQYFWKHWQGHQPDAKERVVATLEWISSHGYKPIFYEEGFLGAPL